jgi:hypothetical protein
MEKIRWVLTGLISAWAINQLWSFLAVILVLSGMGSSAGITPDRIEVLSSLNAIQLGMVAGNAFGYTIAAALIALRYKLVLPVYSIALVLDLGSWATYSTQFEYEQLLNANMTLLDWFINLVLLLVLFGLIILNRSSIMRPVRTAS